MRELGGSIGALADIGAVMTKGSKRFATIKILVLEDDYFIARDIARVLDAGGVTVIGPFSNLEAAQTGFQNHAIDGGILDVKLADAFSFSLAESFLERGLPFIFITGLNPDHFPDHLRHLPRVEKPFAMDQVVDWLGITFAMPSGSPVARDEALSNLVLSSFERQEIERLRPHMLRVKLKRRSVLQRPNQIMERVYFPETAIVSILMGAADKITEVGMVGKEGVIGFPALEQTYASPMQFIVQADGDAIAIAAAELYKEINQSSHLLSLFYSHQYVLSLQIAHTALAHAAFSIEQRLARWLLMYEDRMGHRVSIVHEFLSLMLHVRRPSVTLAIQSLEAVGAISTERGQIIIQDRETLLRMAGASYGVPEKEQARLFQAGMRQSNNLRYAGLS